MRLTYLVAAHNEAASIADACAQLMTLRGAYPDLLVYLIENGSTDDTFARCQALSAAHPDVVRAVRCARAGLGLAFRDGLHALDATRMTKDDWIVLAAADLPFKFTDVNALAGVDRDGVDVFVGSKAHPDSLVGRSWTRRLGSFAFFALRKITLGLTTRDPQGSILIRGEAVMLLRNFVADDYFFSVELIDRAERGGRVVELPVRLRAEVRPSRVRVVRDGFRLLKQLLRYRFTRRS